MNTERMEEGEERKGSEGRNGGNFGSVEGGGVERVMICPVVIAH